MTHIKVQPGGLVGQSTFGAIGGRLGIGGSGLLPRRWDGSAPSPLQLVPRFSVSFFALYRTW